MSVAQALDVVADLGGEAARPQARPNSASPAACGCSPAARCRPAAAASASSASATRRPSSASDSTASRRYSRNAASTWSLRDRPACSRAAGAADLRGQQSLERRLAVFEGERDASSRRERARPRSRAGRCGSPRDRRRRADPRRAASRRARSRPARRSATSRLSSAWSSPAVNRSTRSSSGAPLSQRRDISRLPAPRRSAPWCRPRPACPCLRW